MRLKLLLILLLFVNNLFSQIPSWDWAWSIGGNNVDQIDFLQIDEQGNSYVCGNFKSPTILIGGSNYAANNSQPKSFFAKVSTSGQLLWYKVYPANNQSNVNFILDLIEGFNNTYYVLMQYSGTINLDGFIFTNNFQQGRTLVVKYNAAGNVIDAYHLFDTSVNNNILTTAFVQTVKHPRGGFAFLGFSIQETVLNGISVPANSNYIGYMDTLGSVQEIHLLGGMGEMDSTFDEFPNQLVYRELKVSPKGNVYLSGESNINSYLLTGEVNLNSNLTVDTTTWRFPEINCAPPNNYAVRTFIACFDSTFAFKWSHVGLLKDDISGNGCGANYVGMHVFPDESVILSQNVAEEAEALFDTMSCGPRATPTTYNDGVVSRIAGNGTVSWVKRFDSSDYDNNFINAVTGDGMGNSYLLMYSGMYQNTDGSVYANAVVSKVDVDGNVEWFKGTDNGENGGIYFLPRGFREGGKGNVYLAGGFSSYQAPLPDFNGNVLPWSVSLNPYASDAFIAKLNDCSSLPVDIVSNENQIFCNEDSAFVEVSGGPNFLWSDGDTSQTRFINESGIYTVLSHNNAGCYGNRDTLNLTRLNKIANEQNVLICEGESLAIGNQTFNQSGIYQTVFSSSIGCDSLVTTNLTVDTLNSSVVLNNNVFTALNIPPIAQLQWLNCDDSFESISGAINPTFTASSDGNYALETISGNCRDTSDCVLFSSVGLNSITSNQFNIYPIPARDVLIIESELSNLPIRIFDAQGKLVFVSTTNSKRMEIDVRLFQSGIYLLLFENESKQFVILH
jgi:hypothetical protein